MEATLAMHLTLSPLDVERLVDDRPEPTEVTLCRSSNGELLITVRREAECFAAIPTAFGLVFVGPESDAKSELAIAFHHAYTSVAGRRSLAERAIRAAELVDCRG